MSTFTIVTEEAPAPQVQEKIFIKGLPVTHTPPDGEPVQAVYSHPMAYGDRHYVIFNAESSNPSELYVQGSHITPSRSLNDQEMIAYLNEELYTANEEAETYKKRAVRIIADLEKIVEALRDEAQDREWCDEYNQFCTNLNVELSEPHLLLLEQEFEVEVEVVANVTTRVTVSVMARSYEDAQDMVLEDPRMFFDPSEQALEEAQNSGFDDYDVNFV
jgi:hypothetical protein